MIGEVFAVLSACAFAVGNASIAKAFVQKRGDNGAFLSIIMTCLLSGVLWLAFGLSVTEIVTAERLGSSLCLFVIAGLLSMVVGRSTMFKSIEIAGATIGSLFRRLIPVFAALLAFIILGETISLWGGVGMAIIALGVLLVMFETTPVDRRRPVVLDDSGAEEPASRMEERAIVEKAARRLGMFYGVASSASYGGSYVGRKLGMYAVPDPTLGAFIGAVTGIVWYILGAMVSANYRRAFVCLVRDTGPWQLVAAVSISVGQTLAFFALKYTGVATVAIIGSFEVFVSAFLASYVFRTEGTPSRYKIIASILATLGVIIVAVC